MNRQAALNATISYGITADILPVLEAIVLFVAGLGLWRNVSSPDVKADGQTFKVKPTSSFCTLREIFHLLRWRFGAVEALKAQGLPS